MSLLDALLLDPAPFDIWIAARTDGVNGSGTLNDPYDGSTQARFDAIMKEIAIQMGSNPVTIHLGPGTYETNGYSDATANDSWQARSGMRLIGSGMKATALKLVNASTTNEQYYAIGHPLNSSAKADLFEVCDLTVDCNFSGNGTVSCGAVRVMGDHVRIRRVRAIKWGTKSTTKPCFALAVLSAAPDGGVAEAMDVGIEDCIVTTPLDQQNTAQPSTAIHAGGVEAGITNSEAFGRGPLIRNCYVDCGRGTYTSLLTKYRGLSLSWCIGGIAEGNQVHNTDIGLYLENNSARDIIVRKNFFKNVTRGVFLNAGGISGTPLGTARNLTRGGSVATISMSSVANLSVGDRVTIKNAHPYDSTHFNGVYMVTGVLAASSQFTIAVPATGPTSVTVDVDKPVNVGRAVIEGNTVELCTGVSGVTGIAVVDQNDSSTYAETPDYVNGDIVVTNNKIRYTDGATPTGTNDVAIDLRGTKRAIVNNNIVDSANPHPFQARRWGTVRFFNNQTEAGEYRPGVISDAGETQDDLAVLAQEADDAFVLAYLER